MTPESVANGLPHGYAAFIAQDTHHEHVVARPETVRQWIESLPEGQ